MRGILRTLAVVAVVALVAGSFFHLGSRPTPKPPLKFDVPKALPSDRGLDFSARGLNGQRINLSNYRGHPVIVDFWATWCGPCRKQIPELISLYKRYNKSRGLVVIGLSCDSIQGDGLRAVAPFVEEFQINYPIGLADEALVDSLGVEAIPTTLFVGPDGKIVSRIVGIGHAGELTESTRALLDGGKRQAAPTEANGHVVDL